MGLSRRGFMRAAIIACPFQRAWADTDFWNTKEPAAWSSGEKERLLSNSPWARVIRAKPPERVTPPWSGALTDGGDSHSNPRGRNPLPNAPPLAKQDNKNPLAFYGSVTVRWVSAKPLRQILPTPIPQPFEKHYVISVTGLPARLLARDGAIPSPLPKASLFVGKTSLAVAEFVALTMDNLTLLFAFPISDRLRVPGPQKRVTFTMTLDGITLGAKFDLGAMLYRGQLAL